ncbi:hypothetical protein H4R19_007141, partial [Coemansia spiralis]
MTELGESAPAPGREPDARHRRRPSISDRGGSTRPASPGPAPWQRGGRSPSRDRGRRRSRSPRPARSLQPPSTPPWLYRRPADHYYPNGFRDPRQPAHPAPWDAHQCYGQTPYAAPQPLV